MIETERLILREWRDADADVMYEMGRDPRVMAFLGPLISRDETHALVAGQIVNKSLFGHCFWPIERRSDKALLGFCGLNPNVTILNGGIEIGWRLAYGASGQGYAREAAQGCLDWGWANLAIDSIAAMTVPANVRSRGLMEQIGMTRVANGDFDHPDLAEGDPLRRHVLYRIDRPNGR